MKVLGIIPARFGSTRFPGKPLVDIAGKPMIQWVYENALKCKRLDQLVVATDNEVIFDVVNHFGGQAEMTAQYHETGTERCAEVSKKKPEHDVVINIQGDEPLINPIQIETLIDLFKQESAEIGTLIKPSNDEMLYRDPNKIKVTVTKNGRALYFSRSGIPYFSQTKQFYKHLGMYGYRRNTLLEICNLPPSLLEKAESLEQLRWLEYGYSILTASTEIECHSVDVPEDVDVILKELRKTK